MFLVQMNQPIDEYETIEFSQGPYTGQRLNMKASPYDKDKKAFLVRLFGNEGPYESVQFKVVDIPEPQVLPRSAYIINPFVIEIDYSDNYRSLDGRYIKGFNFSKWFTEKETLSFRTAIGQKAVILAENAFSGLDLLFLVTSNSLGNLRFSVTGPGYNAKTNPPPVYTGNPPRVSAILRSTDRVAYVMTRTTNAVAVTLGSGKKKQSFLVPESNIAYLNNNMVVVLDKAFINGNSVRFGLATTYTTDVYQGFERPSYETFSSAAGYLTFMREEGQSAKGVLFEPTPVPGACIPLNETFRSDSGFYGVFGRKNYKIVGLY